MEENVTRLSCCNKEIILIATAHVSRESAELVKEVVEAERPDSVCIELDEQRYKKLQDPKTWENTDIVKVIKSKKVGFMIINLALSSYQKKIAKKLGTSVGQEMLQGIKSAEKTGARLVLADRDIQTTFLRIWRKLNFWEKCKLLFSLVFSIGDDDDIAEDDLTELLKKDILESVLRDMRRQFPKIGNIIISERDQHLAYMIKNAPGRKVVAVLGGAHVPGVKEELFRVGDIGEITTIPPKKATSKIAGWLIPALIVGLIIYGFFTNLETGLRQLSSWVLWNGILAAVFTALSLGHPLSILTAFVVAPISSLNPMLACGWFAGLVEAAIRKPAVKDVNSVPDDILSFKGFFKNRFLRILLVVIMANIGSSLGTFIAGIDIVKSLF